MATVDQRAVLRELRRTAEELRLTQERVRAAEERAALAEKAARDAWDYTKVLWRTGGSQTSTREA